MQKKTHLADSNQVTFAEQFAAPDLYRNDQHTYQKSTAYKVGHLVKGKEVGGINCVAVNEVSRASLLMGLDSFPFYNDQGDKDAPIFIQRAKFYADKVVRYPIRIDTDRARSRSVTSMANLTRGKFNGFISKESGRVIRKRLEAWIKAIQINSNVYQGAGKPKHSHLVFATLTLPSGQVHGDNEIKRSVLMPFLQQLKRLHGVEQYFWSAEPQENGNVHFHCLFDRWISCESLDQLWNSATDNLGYFGRYFEATGDTKPPSTQIRQCPKDMSLVKYVLKYVSKQPEIRCSRKLVGGESVTRISYWTREELKGGSADLEGLGLGLDSPNVFCEGKRIFREFERRPIEGRSWGMSKELTKLDVYTADCSYRVLDFCSIMEWEPSVKLIKKDRAEIYCTNVHDMLLRHDPVILSDYRKYYLKIYQTLYVLPVQPVIRSIPLPVVVQTCTDQPPEFLQARMFAG